MILLYIIGGLFGLYLLSWVLVILFCVCILLVAEVQNKARLAAEAATGIY